jgi:hypothetical protein
MVAKRSRFFFMEGLLVDSSQMVELTAPLRHDRLIARAQSIIYDGHGLSRGRFDCPAVAYLNGVSHDKSPIRVGIFLSDYRRT